MSVRLANARGRASLLFDGVLVDVEQASSGRFPADPMGVLGQWEAFADWARGVRPAPGAARFDERALEPPVPRPRQVFAIGLNYRSHAEEAGMELPRAPMVFTKFPTCLVGPRADVVLSSDFVDWEVELVVVIGRRTARVSEERALEHVAGYSVGQDISDRKLQFGDKPPQFSLGKSLATFGPLGPAVVSLDALADPNDLALTCDVGGERVQDARTSDMIFGVPALIAYLSSKLPLEPGDIVFTGTPAGVGSTRTPRRYLRAGEEITSAIEGLGTLVNRCVAAAG